MVNEGENYLYELAKSHIENGRIYDMAEPSERPSIDQILIQLEKALESQQEQENHQEKIEGATSKSLKLAHLQIPLEEIVSATNNFSDANLIGRDGIVIQLEKALEFQWKHQNPAFISKAHSMVKGMTSKSLKGKDLKHLEIPLIDIQLATENFGKLANDAIYTKENINGIAPVARRRFNEGTIREMVDPKLMEETHDNIFTSSRGPDQDSLDTFTKIAYQCVAESQTDRPTAEVIIKELEEALSLQENIKDHLKFSLDDIKTATQDFSHNNLIGHGGFGDKSLEFQEDYEIWERKLPDDYEQIFKISNFLEIYSTKRKKDLHNLLSTGIILQKGTMWFSVGANGERNEMISAWKFLYKQRQSHKWKYVPHSRFQKVAEMLDFSNLKIKMKIQTQLLSPGVNYGIHLIFRICGPRKSLAKQMYVNLKYKKGRGSETLHAYFATWREDDWMMIELCRFSNDKENIDLEFLLESLSRYYCGSHGIYVEGIEFRAIDNVKHEETDEIQEVQQVLKSDSNVNLMQQLPTNLEEIFKRSENEDGDEKLFLLNEVNGKKYLMLSAKAALYNYSDVKLFKTKPSIQSRFLEVIELLPQQVLRINCKMKSQMLSRDTDYTCYLVFKLSEKCRGLHCPVKVRNLLHRNKKEVEIIYFRSPKPWNLHDTNQAPQQRPDGWMEVKLEFVKQSLSLFKIRISRSNFQQADFQKIEMPIFDGEDSHGWIDRVERYYEIQGIKDTERLKTTSLCMEGLTLAWYRWAENQTPFRTWATFKQRLLARFQLSYEGTFEKMTGHLGEFPEQVLEGTFIKGLELAPKSSIRVMQPKGVTRTMVLAVMINENRPDEDVTENCGELGDNPQFHQYSVAELRFHLEDKVFVWKGSNDTTQRLGFDDLQIKYVASDWVYLTFLSEEVCARFKKCNGIKAYFSLFRPVVNGFFVKERAVWIEMIGLPCCAWNEDVVSKVTSMWGDVCFLDDDGDAPLAIMRACIKTSKLALIHETVKVVAQGIEYDVAVREISNWEPDILEEGEVGSDIPDLSDEEEPKDFFGEDTCDIQKDCQEGNGNEEVADSLNVDNTPNLGDRGAGFVDRKCHFFQTSGRKKKVHRCFEDDERVKSILVDASVKSPTRPERDSSPADEEIRQGGVVGGGTSESLSQSPGFQREKLHGNFNVNASASRSSGSHGSSKLLKKKVLVGVEDIEDVLKQYFEMGDLLGYDMKSHKDKVSKILSSIGVVQVDRSIVYL
ncbi:unnamed protein product [Lactuca virosa]|uniref:DUF4283 domain-containing protein n=1 Tax=Lactuca virosa TaxID=75947 RepID=A0AAU9NW82_9ASTR|nr:unnamed protein product [Lactuca virosa]